MKSSSIIITTIVALLVILAGVGYLLLGKLSPLASPAQQTTPPTEQPAIANQSQPVSQQSPLASEQLPPNFDEKIENLKKTIADVCATGESKDVTLVFTEAEANEAAAKLLAQVKLPEDIPLEVRGIRIDFKSDDVVLTEIDSVIYGFKITIKVRALVGTEAGKPRVEVTNISFGIVPLPKTLKEKITASITRETESLLNRLDEGGIGCNGKIDLEFTQVRTQEDRSTVALLVRRRPS